MTIKHKLLCRSRKNVDFHICVYDPMVSPVTFLHSDIPGISLRGFTVESCTVLAQEISPVLWIPQTILYMTTSTIKETV